MHPPFNGAAEESAVFCKTAGQPMDRDCTMNRSGMSGPLEVLLDSKGSSFYDRNMNDGSFIF
jgi:hypothetical protein